MVSAISLTCAAVTEPATSRPGSFAAFSRPPTAFLIRQAAGLEKAANDPGREVAGSVTAAQVKEIAETKMPDLNANNIEGAILQVEGTARSMGIEVK